MASDILIVDDEEDIRELIAGILEDEGHQARTAGDSDTALEIIRERRPNLIFLDIWIQGSKLDGLELLDIIKKDHPELPIVMISGHGNIETAVSAIQRGAYDYIEKPFKVDRLVLVAERALETSNLKKQVRELQKRSTDMPELLGESLGMSNLRSLIECVSPTNSRIMITGASGSGKEHVARTIHENSLRKTGPFVILNAASMTADKMEVELFGTEGVAGQQKIVGALEEAHNGTLYIDEIADMPRETQNKILRVLVHQQFQRVGGATKVKVDVRVFSSTSQDLAQLIEDGDFHQDLFHRLAVVPIDVPPLKERREDIPLLVNAFMKQIMRQSNIVDCQISDDAMAVLQAHDWPGNIRQLRNNIERLLILSHVEEGTVITTDMLPDDVGEMLPRSGREGGGHIMSLPLKEAREVFERDFLMAQVERFGGNVSRTANFVGMERSALHRKLKLLGLVEKKQGDDE
ncbi:MAG: sigma-54-dependent Fis family transcriptional regulator [Hyphomicrobiales bacterium]|nr:sigma-54-dependent Fis family transcriptional regulator [Hyphomicrobiales bacterium]